MSHLWEIHQDFSHLVTALTTTNVDDNVTVRELGHTLTDDSLSTAESTGDTDRTTLDTREQRIQDSLADDEGGIGGELLVNWTRHTNGPYVHHAVFGLLAIELDFQQLFLDGEVTGSRNTCDGSSGSWG